MHVASPSVFFRFVERVGFRIQDLYRTALYRGASDKRPRPGKDPDGALDLLVFGGLIVAGGPPVFAPFVAVDTGMVGAAQPGSRGDHRP